MVFTLSVDLNELRLMSKKMDRFVREAPKAARELHKGFGRDVRKHMRENLSRRLYPRRVSISEDIRNQVSVRTEKKKTVVSVMASYAAPLETGSRPHMIGNWMHPGTRNYPSQHFTARAIHSASAEFHKHVRDYFNYLDRVMKA